MFGILVCGFLSNVRDFCFFVLLLPLILLPWLMVLWFCSCLHLVLQALSIRVLYDVYACSVMVWGVSQTHAASSQYDSISLLRLLSFAMPMAADKTGALGIRCSVVSFSLLSQICGFLHNCQGGLQTVSWAPSPSSIWHPSLLPLRSPVLSALSASGLGALRFFDPSLPSCFPPFLPLLPSLLPFFPSFLSPYSFFLFLFQSVEIIW